MKSFRRAIGYILPYRARLIGSIIFVLLIALLWAGGLTMILPGAKILISPEGLHGWADQSVVTDRLKVGVTVRELPDPLTDPTLPAELRNFDEMLEILSVRDDGPAGRAGIEPGWRIVGLRSEQGDQFYQAERMLAVLAADPDQPQWRLLLLAPDQPGLQPRDIAPAKVGMEARGLSTLAGRIPRPESGRDRFRIFAGLLVIAIIITVLRDLFRFFQEYLVQTTICRGMMDLRCQNYDVALHVPLSFYARNGVNDTISRFISDIGELNRGLITLFGKTMVEPFKLVGAFAAAMLFNWKLTILACVAGPPAYLLIRKLGKLMRRASKRALEGYSTMLSRLEETLAGIRVVKAYTMESAEKGRFKKVNRQLYRQQKRIAAISAATAPSVEALGIIAAMAAVALAGYWVMDDSPRSFSNPVLRWLFSNNLDRERFLALIAALAAMYDPVRKLSPVINRFHAADAAADRVFELHDQAMESDVAEAIDLPRHRESIEFKNVTFTYPNAAVPAVAEVNLKIDQGRHIALVGSNGSGKTTLLSLLPRFFSPDSGSVTIDGVDIHKATLKTLREQIAVVTQETVIFQDTLAANISYGRPDATRAQVIEAARQASADEFIEALPDGYDAVIGERGSTLSGGQRQRIAIARAIMRDPAILILDEATSQIDSESEARIHEAITSFRVGRTTLTIAHRFSTVVGADQVVVMHEGRIVDIGTHHELLTRCGLYRGLFETQLIHDDQ